VIADSMVPVLSEVEMHERVTRGSGYEPWRDRAEAAVVDWRWSRGLSGWDHPEPLFCEREGWKRGRLRRERRAGRFRDQDLVGLDADQRPVFVRDHDGAGQIVRETFLHWTPAEVQAATFQMPPYMVPEEPEFIMLKALLLRDGVAVGLQLFHPSKSSLGCGELYDYDDAGRLVRVDLQVRYLPDDGWPDRLDRLLPVYDESGALIALDRVWSAPTGPTRERVWRIPPSREELQAWKDAVRSHLPQAVLDALGDPDAPAAPAVIALIYHEQQILAGASVLGSIGLQAHTDSHDGLLLHPADWIDGHELKVRLDERPELAAALEELDLELLAKPGFGRSLLNDVAAAVTAGQWPNEAHPDRFAFAVDIEGEHGEANARKTLGRARYRQLEAARWF
jgi:hypothetical protein